MAGQLRVLHLASSFPRHADDHVAPFLLDLARAQAQAGLRVTVLAPHERGAARRERIDGVEVRRFRYAPDRLELLAYRGGLLGRARTPVGAALLPLYLLTFALATWRVARTVRPDVLHAHWWLPAGACALPTARALNLSLMVTVHGSDGHLLAHRPVGWVGRAVLRRAGLVGAVSTDLADVAADVGGVPADRLRLLPMPVAAAPTRVAPMPPAPPLRLLAAGRLSPEKGFDALLRAVALARAQGLDVEVTIVGDGPERDRLVALAAPLGERVRLLPAESRGRLWERMDACHAVVVPSRREGLGLIALEALARGRLVVASRVGGLPEALAGTQSRLVPPDDPDALAGALVELAAALPAPAGSAPAPGQPAALAARAPAQVARAHLDAYGELVRGSAVAPVACDAPVTCR